MMKHITVCVCTYKRPVPLQRLLQDLCDQDTAERFTYSIVVTDNDSQRSAEAVVCNLASSSTVPIKYCVETQRNISRARNKAIANATGDFVATIDDDEYPTKRWLQNLFDICNKPDVDGVLGPVLPHFSPETPRWVVKGGFYDRPQHPTGMVLDWPETRTGNVLMKAELFAGDAQPFNPQCLEGSDQEFFKRMMKKGRVFVWCDEAVVYEVVPPARWKRNFLVRRALFRGIFSLRNHGYPLRLIATSLVAAPAYAVALPVALVLGQARFMNFVFKFSYHVGRLLAVLGINPIREAYVSE